MGPGRCSHTASTDGRPRSPVRPKRVFEMELHGLAAAAAAAAARLARKVGNTRDAGAASRIWVTYGVGYLAAQYSSMGCVSMAWHSMSSMAPLEHHRDRPDDRISGAVE